MDFDIRKVIDLIPETLYGPKFSESIFSYLVKYAKVTQHSSVLEIGPYTGKGTEAFLKTGCDYHSIELSENQYNKIKTRFVEYPNFNIIHDDFIFHDFKGQKFDVIYASSSIMLIQEEVFFSKAYELLKPGGILAMISVKSEYRTTNPELYEKIQEVYSKYFKSIFDYPYGSFKYTDAIRFGFKEFKKHLSFETRELTSDEYVSYISTDFNHLFIYEPYRSKLFVGIKEAILNNGNKIVLNDTVILNSAKKPE